MKCEWCEAEGRSSEAAAVIDGYGFCQMHEGRIQDHIRSAGLARASAELSLARLAWDDMRAGR